MMATSCYDPNLLPMLELSTDSFRWIPKERFFATETSRLGMHPLREDFWWLQQLYRDDPEPQGICVRSHRTGDVRRFLLIHREVRRDWPQAWLFESIEPPTMFAVIYDDAAEVHEHVEVRAV